MNTHFLEKFRPHICAQSLYDVDLQDLKSKGIRCILLDMDNTLLPWKGIHIPQSTRDWVETATDMGFKLCIVSNTHSPRRLKTVGEELGIKTVCKAVKPRRRGFHSAMRMLNSTAEQCVVIGDQMLTDVFGGRRSGMLTILVKPMHPHEFIGTKISRLVERAISSALHRKE